MKEIVFATNNAHKLKEFRSMLGKDWHVLSLVDIGCHDDIPETADTFEGNALQKAMFVAEHYGRCNVVADDSGLCVDALDGAPGVFSARYAGEGHDSEANNARLLAELDGIADRHAHMATAMVFLADAASEPITAVGKIEGEITCGPQGSGGFGYDCLFRPTGWEKTFAEVDDQAKNAVSYRARAVKALVARLSESSLL